MALIKCTECQKEFSDKAMSCPHCGCPTALSIAAKNKNVEGKVENKRSPKRIKTWVLIASAIILAIIIVFFVISLIPEKYRWDDIILKSSLPQPPSRQGCLYMNEADDLYLTVRKISFSEYEEYVNNCIDKGYTFVVESNTSSYNAFNSEGYEVDLNYHEYNEVLDISLDVRVSGTIKWSNRKLAVLLPVPDSIVGSIINDYDEHYEVYIGSTSKDDFNAYILECETNGFDSNTQKQEKHFYGENEFGYELNVEYYDCELMYINLNAPDELTEESDSQTSQNDNELESSHDNDSSNTSKNNSSTTTSQSNTHYCEVTGCTRKGTKTYQGISAKTEYYCAIHYDELIDMMSDMEEDVGKGSYSKHTCEECSREGTHSIIGISGKTEYYCSTHYNELKEFMEIFE